MDRSMYDSARYFLEEALTIGKEISNPSQLIFVYNGLGNLYQNTGDYSKSVGYMLQGLKIAEETNNMNMQARLLTNIGNNYGMQGKLAQAKQFYNKVLDLKDIFRDKEIMAYVNSGLGTVYYNEKNYGKALEVQITAKKYFFDLGDKISMTTVLENIGVTYTKLKEYEKAQDNFDEALKISKSVDDLEGLASINESIGQLLYEEKKYDESILHFKAGLEYSKMIGAKEYEKEAYRLLSDVSAKKGDYKTAYDYNQFYIGVKDSIYNETNSKQVAQMTAQYESEKKEKTIQLMSKEIQLRQQKESRQKIFSYSLIGFSILLILLGGVSYNGYRVKKRTAAVLEEKNTEIYKQNEVLEDQKNLLSKTNVLITDSINYAKRLQESVLPSRLSLKKYFTESFIFYKPKDIVSGDFFWMYELDDTILFAVIDCTGHGVPGAFMSIVGNNILNHLMIEKKITDPNLILDELNTAVHETIKQPANEAVRDGMDLALCAYNMRTKKIVYSGAKNSVCVFSENNFIELKADKISIGNQSGKKFTKQEYILKKGDMVYLFSDGYADQKGGPENKKFYYDTFRNLLERSHTLPVNEQEALLDKTMNEWIGSHNQLDDMMVMGIKIS